MPRDTALRLRFPSLVYGCVNSRRESRARLVLLASARFKISMKSKKSGEIE